MTSQKKNNVRCNESVEVITEGLFKKKQKKEEKYYAPLTKEECDKIVSLAKKCIAKYPELEKIADFSEAYKSISEHISKDKVTSSDEVIICYGDLWDYPGFNRHTTDGVYDDMVNFNADLGVAISESGIKAKVAKIGGDWDDFDIGVISRKPL